MLRILSFLFLFIFLCSFQMQAQESKAKEEDSLYSQNLEEVIIIAHKTLAQQTEKPLGTLDNYLEKSSVMNLIKRGAYAWEPFINGMASERSVITIDGMRIYAACTDKMDPTTSYVEISNLSKANIHSATSGSSAGATIAGGLDLIQRKTGFGSKNWNGSLMSGLEWNNMQKIFGGSMSYQQPDFYWDASATYRNAKNYKAGGGEEILYSQFSKLNLASNLGYKVGAHQELSASLIFDNAIDVGYPALPMDVALARAYIAAVNYTRHHLTENIHHWETKVYYNDVKHVMDDTKRPIVPIRMDMPGWSRTAGFYSKILGDWMQQNWMLNLSGHQNYSYAEMTMYANNPGEKEMFMLTWPGVKTHYLDLYGQDEWQVSETFKLNFNFGLAMHNNIIQDTFGFQSLQIFYPELKKSNTRFLKRLSGNASYQLKDWIFNLGLSYGERAPSVSEAYGFYLFNSFDKHDYVGNPLLENEKSTALNFSLAYGKERFFAKFNASYFYIFDYIIGIPNKDLVAMTIGGAGVRIYQSIPNAQLSNFSLDLTYQLLPELLWTQKLSYRRGLGETLGNLPMMQPFSYNTDLSFSYLQYKANVNFLYQAAQEKISVAFGEKPLPTYYLVNLSASRSFQFGKHTMLLNVGLENLLDRHYTTFADWNRIPRMGRNIFCNVVWQF